MRQRPEAQPRAIARWAASLLIGLIVCAGPLWLWGVPLRWYYLKSDDFVYLAWSRTAAAVRGHLATPYHGHVAPLYLLETHLLARLAGTMEALPVVLGWASYATLVLAMAATGHVVARESGRVAHGLAAMAAVGLSSVLGPTLLWYAAGQALAAGTAVLVMLAALQSWRVRGGWWRLGGGLVAATAAPLFWSAGYAAGPVGMAYLWADGRRACRRAAVIVAASSIAVVAVVWCVAGRGFAPASHIAARPLGGVLVADAVVAHSAQAVCEALVLNNLGLDASTTPGQALLFTALLAGFWAWSRRRSGPAGSSALAPDQSSGGRRGRPGGRHLRSDLRRARDGEHLRQPARAGLVRRHGRARRRAVRRRLVRRELAVPAALGDRAARAPRAFGPRALHRRGARPASSSRRSRDLRVRWDGGTLRDRLAAEGGAQHPRRARRAGPGAAPGPGRTGPPRAGRTPGRDRPRGDPTGRRPGGRPGDAGASPRLRTRGLARSARGLDAILTSSRGTTGDEPISVHDRESHGGGGRRGGRLRRLPVRPDAGPGGLRRGRARAGRLPAPRGPRVPARSGAGCPGTPGRQGRAGPAVALGRHGARGPVLRPGHVRAEAARTYRAGPAGILPALQRRRGVRGGLADLGPHGGQPARAAQHAHRAGLAAGDLGPGRLRGEPAAAAGGPGTGIVRDPGRGDVAGRPAGRAGDGSDRAGPGGDGDGGHDVA